MGVEVVAAARGAHHGGAVGVLILGVGQEDAQETLHDQVENLGGIPRKLNENAGGDDGEVVAHLAAVEHALGGHDAALLHDALGKGAQFLDMLADGCHGAGCYLEVVVRQVLGVRARVGEHLVLLVAFLRNLQGAAGGEAVAVAGLFLQGGEVEEQGRRHGDRFLNFRYLALLALAAAHDGLGGLSIPYAFASALGGCLVLAPLGVVPAGFVASGGSGEGGAHLAVGFRAKSQDIFLALGEQGQGGCLHAAGGGYVEAACPALQHGEGAGAVQAHQPVGLGAADGGVRQVGHLFIGLQVVPGLQDGVVRHALHPQAAQGFADLAVADDVAEDELALAPGIACVHQLGYVLALGQFQHLAQSVRAAADGFQLHAFGHHGQVVHFPRQTLAVLGLRFLLLYQVADGGGDDHSVPFVAVHLAVALEFAELFAQHAR